MIYANGQQRNMQHTSFALEDIKFLLKFYKIKGYFTWRHFYIYENISLNFCQNENVLDKNCRGNKKIIFNTIFP
jgi:hypothetical protein